MFVPYLLQLFKLNWHQIDTNYEEESEKISLVDYTQRLNSVETLS